MTDDELALESARGRMIGMISVLTVAMYSGFILTSYFALKSGAGGNNAEHLKTIYEHKGAFIMSGLFFSVGSILVAGVLVHILLAGRSRSKLVPKISLYAAVGGPVLAAVIFPAYVIAQVSAANKFADAAVHSNDVATKLLDSGFLHFTTTAYLFAQMVVAIAWVMTGVFGMRVGLLTRLVGIVAIAIGAANILAPPFAALLQVFWIGAMAIQLLGESSQTPPAWKLGRPVPWSEVAAVGRASFEDPQDFEKPSKGE
jgi:hypothetical protein